MAAGSGTRFLLALLLAAIVGNVVGIPPGRLAARQYKSKVLPGATPSEGPLSDNGAVLPPVPLLPIPNAAQLEWQYEEQAMFIHFGVNTFTGKETGDGTENPAIFNPKELDARQWAKAAKDAGFRSVVMVAKHLDGFCMWPSKYTNHSVKSSPWRNGRGDLMREVSDAVRHEGLRMGWYLCPMDFNCSYFDSDPKKYNEFFMAQLRELLTQYGPAVHNFYDDGDYARYDFQSYWALNHQLQPQSVIFSAAASQLGYDVRWVGDEQGYAADTVWSTLDVFRYPKGTQIPESYLLTGEQGAPAWIPAECEVPIRTKWFWADYQHPKSLEHLIDIYFNTVGRNCKLVLNLSPDTRGLIPEEDVDRLREWRAALDSIFDRNLVQHSDVNITASSVRGDDYESFGPERVLDEYIDTYWAPDESATSAEFEVKFERNVTFNVAVLQEPVALGQRVISHHIDAWVGKDWERIVDGTTIGHKWLHRFEPVITTKVRVVMDKALATPLLATFGLYHDLKDWQKEVAMLAAKPVD